MSAQSTKTKRALSVRTHTQRVEKDRRELTEIESVEKVSEKVKKKVRQTWKKKKKKKEKREERERCWSGLQLLCLVGKVLYGVVCGSSKEMGPPTVSQAFQLLRRPGRQAGRQVEAAFPW